MLKNASKHFRRTTNNWQRRKIKLCSLLNTRQTVSLSHFDLPATFHLCFRPFRCNLCFVICHMESSTEQEKDVCLLSAKVKVMEYKYGIHTEQPNKRFSKIKSEKSHTSDSINCYQYHTTRLSNAWIECEHIPAPKRTASIGWKFSRNRADRVRKI